MKHHRKNMCSSPRSMHSFDFKNIKTADISELLGEGVPDFWLQWSEMGVLRQGPYYRGSIIGSILNGRDLQLSFPLTPIVICPETRILYMLERHSKWTPTHYDQIILEHHRHRYRRFILCRIYITYKHTNMGHVGLLLRQA